MNSLYPTIAGKRVTRAESTDSGVDDYEDEEADVADRVVDSGSLQRRRTAWTTGIGHQRVSTEELDHRCG